MTENIFADPVPVESPSECYFYHALDLPRSGKQEGHWDLRGQFDKYTGGVKFAEKTVLDVGTASGFLTFEAEKRGATVVSVEAESAEKYDRLPSVGSLIERDYNLWIQEGNKVLASTKRAYWLAHREFNSQARAYYGDIYALPDDLGLFDIVIVGQILVHLSDGIRALNNAVKHCKQTFIVAEGMFESETPLASFLVRAEKPENNFSFWHYSTGFYKEYMKAMGFGLKHNKTHKYRCNVPGWKKDLPITTMVFERERE